MPTSVFLGGGITVSSTGALTGTGSGASPLAVAVDGTTIEVNGSNQLALTGNLPNDAVVDAGTGTADAGVGGVLTISTTPAQTGANTTETDLWTYSLPANTLSTNNYGVRITVSFTYAANTNNKSSRVYFAGTVVSSRVAGADNAQSIVHQITVLRTGASAQIATGTYIKTGAIECVKTTPAGDTTGAIVIKATGQNGTANAGDVVFDWATVEFLRAGA